MLEARLEAAGRDTARAQEAATTAGKEAEDLRGRVHSLKMERNEVRAPGWERWMGKEGGGENNITSHSCPFVLSLRWLDTRCSLPSGSPR